MSASRRQVQVRYEGEVQGVGFRFTVYSLAQRLELAGVVENLPNGSVRLVAEGPEDALQRLLLQIQVSRLGGTIDHEAVEWRAAQGLAGFACR